MHGIDEKGSDNRELVVSSSTSGITRWAPLAIVLSVVGGFITLSWYAYHAGMQSVKEEDLLVVEADKTPMKEKPADPGGMQFPNQDKTVFETFASSGHQPPKVERVLPVPEKPMPKDMDASDTSTWINDKSHNPAATEQVIGKEPPKKTEAHAPASDTAQAKADHQVIAAQAQGDEESVTYIAPKKSASPGQALDNAVKATDKRSQPFAPEKVAAIAEKPKDKPKQAEPPEEGDAQAVEQPQEKQKEDKKAIAGAFMVQLGAYRSEEEATAAWQKMHIKQKELSDKNPVIIKADLGDKGIYYRLRAGGLSSPAQAKALCNSLSSKGQACILPPDKQ